MAAAAAAAAHAVDISAVNNYVRQAIQGIKVNKRKGQTLIIQDLEYNNTLGLLLVITLHNHDALSRCPRIRRFCFNYCQLPGHVIIMIFQSAIMNQNFFHVSAYERVRLEGQGLVGLLEFIPKMHHLRRLSVNLDFTDASVLAAFHRNSSIQHLSVYTGPNDREEEITDGPVFASLDRNRRLANGNKLLDCEPKRMVPLGLWSNAIEQLTRDNTTGATAVYKIMQEKLVMWWAPNNVSTTAATTTTTGALENTQDETASDIGDGKRAAQRKRPRLS